MKITKITALVVALTMLGAMLTGCGGSGTSGDINESVANLEGYLASAEPLEMTIHMHYFNNYVFDDDARIYKEAAKETNITLHGTASKASSDSNQSFNTMLVESTLPDIIHGNATNTNKAGMEGAMIPLEDLIPKFAPHIDEYFKQHPEYYKGSFAADGHLYYIPCIYEPGPAMGWFIRQDWLDKLNLPAPKTVSEYHDVLKAFRDKDPNGNGIKDEIPYFDRHKSPINLLSLFGVSKNNYDVDSNNKIYMPRMTVEYKNAVKELSKWYAEGLIDPEIYSRGGTSREQLFGGNMGGAVHDWFSSSFAFNNSLKESVPGFKLVAIDPPADINGKVSNCSPRTELNGNGWGISKDNKHIAETMKYFDFWFTEKGRILNNYGVEGIDYNIVNGEPEYSEQAKAYEGGIPAYMTTFGSREIGIPTMQSAEIKGMSKEAADSFKMYVDKGYTIKAFPRLAQTEEETRIIRDKGAAVETYIEECAQSWVMGNRDIEADWDEYISKLKEMGADEVIAAYQSAYDRYLKN